MLIRTVVTATGTGTPPVFCCFFLPVGQQFLLLLLLLVRANATKADTDDVLDIVRVLAGENNTVNARAAVVVAVANNDDSFV